MSTAELKSSLHQLIEGISDSSKLQAIYILLAKQEDNTVDWADELSEQVRKDIELSLKQAKQGNVVTHEEFTEQLQKKYPHLNL